MNIPEDLQDGVKALLSRVKRDGSYSVPFASVTIVNPCRRFIRRLPDGTMQTSDDEVEWVDMPDERLMYVRR